jgi:hypothetical protein
MKMKQHPLGGPPGLTRRGQQWPPEDREIPDRPEHPEHPDHPEHPAHPPHPEHPQHPEQRAPGPESESD